MTEEFTVISPGDELGQKFGFTKELFTGYLSLQDNTIWISAIQSLKPGRHNLTHLFNSISSQGYQIKVPNPFPKMEQIVKKKGFIKTTELFPEVGEDIDVWIKVTEWPYQIRRGAE